MGDEGRENEERERERRGKERETGGKGERETGRRAGIPMVMIGNQFPRWRVVDGSEVIIPGNTSDVAGRVVQIFER